MSFVGCLTVMNMIINIAVLRKGELMDLIERQAAIRKLKRMATQAYIDKLNGSAETVINCCIDVIERQIPSAQPEIIHCRECKHLEYDIIFDGHFCRGRRVKLDHFCGYAERRTDAKN